MKPAYAYVETSALDRPVKCGISPAEVRRRLNEQSLTPCVGGLTLNECAQPILSDLGSIVVTTFQLIRSMSPRFLASPDVLYTREVRLLQDRGDVSFFMTPAEERAAENEVDAVASGKISFTFLELLRKRRSIKFEEWPAFMNGYLSKVADLRHHSAEDAPRFRTYDQLAAFFSPDLAQWIGGMPGVSVSPSEANIIARSVDKFPAIVTTVHYWWNAFFICLSDGRIPSTDKVDDYRHAVEAAYCQVFVSGDKQLLRSLERLNRWLTPLDVETFLAV
jgi:hypothetical protein